MSYLEMVLQQEIIDAKLPRPTTEFRFHPKRRWRFDLAWPELMCAVEIEGGVWIQGRHNRGSGFIADCEKYNEAILLGWRVLRVPGGWVEDGSAMGYVRKLIDMGLSEREDDGTD